MPVLILTNVCDEDEDGILLFDILQAEMLADDIKKVVQKTANSD